MIINDVRNNHLCILINKILDSDGDTIPENLAEYLIRELSLATLISPTHNGNIVLLQLGCKTFVPAFTSFADFLKYCDEDLQPESFDFVRLYNFLDNNLDGVIINPKGFGFIIDLEMFRDVFNKCLEFNDFDELKSYLTPKELNEFREYENCNLEKLIGPNIDLDEYYSPFIDLDRLINRDIDFNKLYEELSKSILFTLMVSQINVDEYAKEGIIPMNKVPVDGLLILNEFGMECGVLFTSFDYLEPVYSILTERGRDVYPHIINLELIVNFIIHLDLDALIINHSHQTIVIPRNYLLKDLDYIVELCSENVKNTFTDFVYLKEYTQKFKGFDIKVRLDDFRPLTWRDLIIPAGITFKDLDNILKILWDFLDYHLSRFTFKNSNDIITKELPDVGFNPGELNAEEIIIDDYFQNNKKIYCEYDYSDGWSFTIEVKKTVEYDKQYPVIKRFKGKYNPQDDIGGVWGLKETIKNNPVSLTEFDKEYIQSSLKNYKDYFNS